MLNLKAADAKKLAYEKALAQRMAAKRQRLLDAAEDDDEGEDGGADDLQPCWPLDPFTGWRAPL